MTDQRLPPWLRLDAAFPEHPKVIALSDAGFRLEISAMCYARRNLTDGHIPTAYPPARLARAIPSLVAAGLWVPAPEGGWLLHDYLSWQLSRAEVHALRKSRSDAGRKGADARWQSDSK
jgi:hypothetical protein